MQQAIKHLAVIMDGNGRWAKARFLPKIEGHRRGVEAAKLLVQNAIKLGIEYLSLYTFSSENWRRPEGEVSDLLKLLGFYLKQELSNLHKQGVRIKVIGDLAPLEQELKRQISNAIELTKSNTRITLCLAFSYGGRMEIIGACKRIIDKERSLRGEFDEAIQVFHSGSPRFARDDGVSENDETIFKQYLYDPEMPDVDLLIRTSGEKRISNFLLWHIAYAELYFTDVLWPDFGVDDLSKAVEDFASRKRNFGGVRGD
jgi:undecaprenyl diphosphate synthase